VKTRSTHGLSADLRKLKSGKRAHHGCLIICLAYFWISGGATWAKETPVHVIGEQLSVRQWLVIGPFPNSEPKAQTTGPKDYLTSLGGEMAAVLTERTSIPYEDEAGAMRLVQSEIATAQKSGMLDLNRQFRLPGKKIAYAFCWLRSSSNQVAQCFFGSGDGVKLWLNGEQVFEKKASFFEQSCIPRQSQFPLALQSGDNKLLVKVENTSGDWGFIFETTTADQAEEIIAEQLRLKQLREFQNVELRAECPSGFVFVPGKFPQIGWSDPTLVEKLWGKLPLPVRWFDGELNEVSEALHPGRYAAYVEGDLPDGRKLRRAITLFCIEPGCEAWLEPGALKGEWILNRLISEDVWRADEQERRQAATAGFGNRFAIERESAIVLAGLSEIKLPERFPAWRETPVMRDVEFHFALKRKILGTKFNSSLLRPPLKKSGTVTPTLRTGAPQEAGVRDETAGRLRAICREWADDGGEPFTVLVARHGVIVLHEAFNCSDKPPVNLQTRFALDSITKTLAGLMFAQFADQRLMFIDEPIGNHLPDFPTNGASVLTFRHCLTHSTGLEGHGAWGGMRNPWLENVIGNGHEYLEPGRRVIYNGMGFDLAGKAMELVADKSIFRLMHENFLDPLGASQVRLNDLGFTAECSAEDLARIGQLMLNRGSYGDIEFFSSETFEQMLPHKASEVCPELAMTDWEYGWGLSWERDINQGKTILSRNTIGHGALSSTVFRVDLENDLIIAIPRAGSGKENGKHLTCFLSMVRESLR
jgi:CubicO group peptidase (beta-lactamase class C family)